MIEAGGNAEVVARVIQVALTPVFLLSAVGTLLSVCSTRLARVADRLDALVERVEAGSTGDPDRMQLRLDHLRRRSHLLDASVILGAVAGASTCLAALLLFVGSLRDEGIVTWLFLSFGLALVCTIGALSAFLTEMLIASRGIRDQAAKVEPEVEAGETPEPDGQGSATGA